MQGNYLNNTYQNLEQYVVKQNDSLYMIAKRYNISVDDLKSVNHLVSNMIYPNQILFIPRHNNVSKNTGYQGTNNFLDGFKNKYTYENSNNHSNKFYVVGQNETIEDILAKFGLSPLEFLKLNENEILEPGERIIIRK